MDVNSKNNWKPVSEYAASSTTLLANDEKFIIPCWFPNYMNLPAGNYYVDAKGVCASSPKTRSAVRKALDYMESIADNNFFLGSALMDRAKYFYNTLLPIAERPKPDEYFYLLYRLNEVCITSIFRGQERLKEMQAIVNSDYLFNTEFNIDTFRKVAEFMLGFTLKQGQVVDIESCLNALTHYYEIGDEGTVWQIIMDHIMNYKFLGFINELLEKKQPLYLLNVYIVGAQLPTPCSVYIEKGNVEGNKVLQIHLSFEMSGRKFYIVIYDRYLKLDDISSLVECPLISMWVK